MNKSQSTLSRTFEALENRDYRLLWLSSMAMFFAMHMQILARGWLIYDLTESELALTWVMLSFLLPSAFFALIGGAIADRLRKKNIMLAAQCCSAVSVFIFGLIVCFGEVNFWHFIYFGLFNGSVMSLSMPARTAVMPDLVKPRTLTNATALSTGTFSLARVAGPTIAGFLIVLFTGGSTDATQEVGYVFFVISLLYILSVLTTSLMHYKGEPKRKIYKSVRREFGDAWFYIRRKRVILGLLLLNLIPGTFGFSAQFLLPAFNVDILNGDPTTLGWLSASLGFGALMGSLLLARMGDIGHKGRVMFILAYLWTIAIVLYAFTSAFWLSMIMLVFVGIWSAAMSSLNMSVVQLVIQPAMRSRVMAIMWGSHGLMPLGVIPIGWLAETVNLPVALVVSAGLLAISAYLIRVWIPEVGKIRRGHTDFDAVEETAAPAPEEKEWGKPVATSTPG